MHMNTHVRVHTLEHEHTSAPVYTWMRVLTDTLPIHTRVHICVRVHTDRRLQGGGVVEGRWQKRALMLAGAGRSRLPCPCLSRPRWQPPTRCPHRPVCGVAGIPSAQSGAQHHMQHAASAAGLPHCSHAGGAGPALAYRAQMDTSPAILMPSSLQAPQTQEQNGILDWLRKLRLHKYYPVFKQLTMEKVCG